MIAVSGTLGSVLPETVLIIRLFSSMERRAEAEPFSHYVLNRLFLLSHFRGVNSKGWFTNWKKRAAYYSHSEILKWS